MYFLLEQAKGSFFLEQLIRSAMSVTGSIINFNDFNLNENLLGYRIRDQGKGKGLTEKRGSGVVLEQLRERCLKK